LRQLFVVHRPSAGEADYLVTGDKSDRLALDHHGKTKIVSVRDFITLARLLQ
jgi:predicted nucleic acid-binding protein